MRRATTANASLLAADSLTHLKIVATSLTAAILIVWLAIATHL
jgi:hypothetical protein